MKHFFYYRVISVLLIYLLLLPSALCAFGNDSQEKTTLAPALLINADQLKIAYMKFPLNLFNQIASQPAGFKKVTGLPLRQLLSMFPDNPGELLELMKTASNSGLINGYPKKIVQANPTSSAAIISALGMIKADTEEEKDVIRALISPYFDSKEPLNQLSAYSVLSKIGTREEQTLAIMKLLEAVAPQTPRVDESLVFQLLLEAEIPQELRDIVSEQIAGKFVHNVILNYPPVLADLLKKVGLSKKAAKLFDNDFFEKLLESRGPEHYIPIIEMLSQEAGRYTSFHKSFRKAWKKKEVYPAPAIKYLIFLSNLEPSLAIIKDLKYNIIYNKKMVSDFAQAVLAGFEGKIRQRRPKSLRERVSKFIMLESIGFQDSQKALETLIKDIKIPENKLRFLAFYGLRKLGIVNDDLRELMREQAENKDQVYYNFFQALVVRDLDFDEEFKMEIIKKLNEGSIEYIYNRERMLEIIANNAFTDKGLRQSILDRIIFHKANVFYKANVFFETRALLSGLIAEEQETISLIASAI